MRIVVSGTHASGKSTLVSDFSAAHRGYGVLPDPFELIDEWDEPGPGMFLLQLQLSAERLLEGAADDDVIAERSPLDFLAYLIASREAGLPTASDRVLEQARAMTATALRRVDVLALLPLNPADHIWVPADENHDLRDAMNDALLELGEDEELVGSGTLVTEITGDRGRRLAVLDDAVRRRIGVRGD